MKLATTAAVISGAASGLGEATARYFSEQGGQVTILDRDVERGQAVAKEIGGYFVEKISKMLYVYKNNVAFYIRFIYIVM